MFLDDMFKTNTTEQLALSFKDILKQLAINIVQDGS